jgi:hypothetical protein
VIVAEVLAPSSTGSTACSPNESRQQAASLDVKQPPPFDVPPPPAAAVPAPSPRPPNALLTLTPISGQRQVFRSSGPAVVVAAAASPSPASSAVPKKKPQARPGPGVVVNPPLPPMPPPPAGGTPKPVACGGKTFAALPGSLSDKHGGETEITRSPFLTIWTPRTTDMNVCQQRSDIRQDNTSNG